MFLHRAAAHLVLMETFSLSRSVVLLSAQIWNEKVLHVLSKTRYVRLSHTLDLVLWGILPDIHIALQHTSFISYSG